MCIAGGVQEHRVWTCVFGSLQVSSDEERRYSRFAGERRVVYHGLPGASGGEDRSRSRLRGSCSESRRPQEERGRRRTRGAEDRSHSGQGWRRGPQARGRRAVGGLDERSRSRIGGWQEHARRSSWEETSHQELSRRGSPRRARSPRRRSPVQRHRRSPLRSLQASADRSRHEVKGTSGESTGVGFGSRARAPSRVRGDSGRGRRRSLECKRVTGRGRSPRRRVAQAGAQDRSARRPAERSNGGEVRTVQLEE